MFEITESCMCCGHERRVGGQSRPCGCEDRRKKGEVCHDCHHCNSHCRCIMKDAEDFLEHYGVSMRGRTIRKCEGAAMIGLKERFGNVLPVGMIAGKTFKVQREGVTFFDKKFSYPLKIGTFEREYRNRLATKASNPNLRSIDETWE